MKPEVKDNRGTLVYNTTKVEKEKYKNIVT